MQNFKNTRTWSSSRESNIHFEFAFPQITTLPTHFQFGQNMLFCGVEPRKRSMKYSQGDGNRIFLGTVFWCKGISVRPWNTHHSSLVVSTVVVAQTQGQNDWTVRTLKLFQILLRLSSFWYHILHQVNPISKRLIFWNFCFPDSNWLIPVWLFAQCTHNAWLQIVWKVGVSNFPGYCQSSQSIPSAAGIEDTFIASKVIWGKYT